MGLAPPKILACCSSLATAFTGSFTVDGLGPSEDLGLLQLIGNCIHWILHCPRKKLQSRPLRCLLWIGFSELLMSTSAPVSPSLPVTVPPISSHPKVGMMLILESS